MSNQTKQPDDLESLSDEIEREIFSPVEASDDSLEDLFDEAMAARKLRRPARPKFDASLRDALEATSQRMREVYSNPENWKRTRGVMLIDKQTQTVLGNYSEYINTKAELAPGVSPPTKWVHEHQPIVIEGKVEIEGFLGAERERKLRGMSWDREIQISCHVLLDQIFAEAPNVRLKICSQISTILRAELVEDTQFADPNGALIVRIPAGVSIWEACSTDTKAAIRKEVA